jgi:hypothetical protein
MAWWFHPDRAEDLLRIAAKNGAVGSTYAETIEDGVRVRTYQWKDRRGWTYSHHAETHLTPHGMAAQREGRFVAPVGDVVTYVSSKGKAMTKTCVGRIEFTPLAGGGTKVEAFHSHSLEGGSWLRRMQSEMTDRTQTEEAFREWIDECQKAEGTTPDNSLDRS